LKDWRNLPRKKGAGRKPNTESKTQALDIYNNAAPKLAQTIVEKALSEKKDVKCPACNHELQIDIPGDSKLLVQLDDRLHGRPVVRSEMDLKATVEVSNDQLIKWALMIDQVRGEVGKLDVTEIEKKLYLPLVKPPEETVEGEFIERTD